MTKRPITETQIRIGLLFSHNVNVRGLSPQDSLDEMSRELGVSRESLLGCIEHVRTDLIYL